MKKIAQIILAVAIVALVYVIYDQISTPIKFDDELKAKKAQVIDRIKDIRTAQRAFKSKYQRFTGSFDTLTNFILQDTLELDTVAYRQEIINLIDDEENNFNRYPGVKFGSMEAGNNEAGNWE